MSPSRRVPTWRVPALLLAAAVGVVAPTAPAAGESPSPPPYYAIENVRVVDGTGTVVEGATVVIGDGLIEAVGIGVQAPADAWVLDGDGMSLFPGLIDAMSDLGLAGGDDGDEGGGGRGGFPGQGGPEIRGPEDRPQTTPWVSAADELKEDSRIEKWREAGFTSALSTPSKGIFAGQAALINLGDGEPRAQVVAAEVAQRTNFSSDGGFRTYPGSLMGVLAYIEQVLIDTDHYTRAQQLYDSSPGGRQRPAYDRALDPLARSIAADAPFLMPGVLGREIDRALALAAEHGVPAVVYGGHGAYRRADRLAETGTPVLVSLDWPEEETDRDPDADTSFRDLYHRRMAPTSPAVLAESGVPFAFYSDGLSSASDVFAGVRTAIDAGLTPEGALAAMTSSAAQILGVDDRVGSIEAGKIANLVLASDWPWAEDVEVAAVFVDGRKYEQASEADEDAEPPAQDVSGTWSFTLETPGGARDMTAELTMSEDGKVKGTIESESGETNVDDGRMSGELLRFKTTREMGGRSMTASWSLQIDGESASGAASAGPMSMDVSGERTAAAAAADEADGDAVETVSLDELREAMAVYQGPVRRMDAYAVTNATVWTLTGAPIEGGTVLVEDGKITAVGADLSIPEGLEVIDAGGGALIPGIIDAHSHTAGEGGLNEGTLAVTSMVGVGDVLNPDDINIYRGLAGGLTSANVLHGSANPIGGQNQIVKWRWGSDAEGLKFEGAPPGIKFALGENPKRSNFRSFSIPQRYPQTRMGVMDVIRQAFKEAAAYRDEWDAHEQALAARGDRRRRDAGPAPMPPRRDLKLEALAEILEGERLVHSHCYRADEILQLLRLAEEHGFRVATLQHVLEGYKIADEIAAHGAGASTFSDWWGYKVEAYDAIPHNSALMAERGVLVSINSDSSEEMRHLNQEAAKAVKWGAMDEVEALKLVTLNPAIQLGIDDRVGSIEVGKDADLVIYDGHPLSMQSVVQKTFVDGDLYFDLEADRERQAMLDDIKSRMMGDGDDEETDGDGGEEEPGRRDRHRITWWDENPYTCREIGR